MKVLFVIDSLGMGGAETMVANLAISESRLGHNVSVLQLAYASGPLQELMKFDNVESIILKHKDRNAFKKNVNSIFNIFKIIPFLRHYDIIHVHLFPCLYWVGFAKMLSFSRTPMVYTEHSTQNRRRGNCLGRVADSFIYRFAYNEIIACADKVLDSFVNVYPNVTSSVISNGIDTAKYMNAIPYTKNELINVPETTKVITMVARFAYPKRQDMLVEALKALPEECHVVFVGGGDSGNVKDKVISCGLDKRVHFLGIRSDVPRILKTSDIVVLASEYEGLSLSSIEGMASGRPFVASNVNGLREVVSGAGLLFEINDVSSLVCQLKLLLQDNAFYETVSVNCENKAKEYDISTMTEGYLKLYSKYIH